MTSNTVQWWLLCMVSSLLSLQCYC